MSALEAPPFFASSFSRPLPFGHRFRIFLLLYHASLMRFPRPRPLPADCFFVASFFFPPPSIPLLFFPFPSPFFFVLLSSFRICRTPGAAPTKTYRLSLLFAFRPEAPSFSFEDKATAQRCLKGSVTPERVLFSPPRLPKTPRDLRIFGPGFLRDYFFQVF